MPTHQFLYEMEWVFVDLLYVCEAWEWLHPEHADAIPQELTEGLRAFMHSECEKESTLRAARQMSGKPAVAGSFLLNPGEYQRFRREKPGENAHPFACLEHSRLHDKGDMWDIVNQTGPELLKMRQPPQDFDRILRDLYLMCAFCHVFEKLKEIEITGYLMICRCVSSCMLAMAH